jgi:hypothetical protein
MFQRERRFVVLKNKDIAKYLGNADIAALDRVCKKINEGRFRDGRSEMDAVVVESDWPEYEPTWKAIERRMDLKEGM